MTHESLTVRAASGQTTGTELVTPKAIVPIGNKGFFMPDLQANYSTSVGRERNTTGIRPEYSRRLWTVTSSRRLSLDGRQPLVKVHVMQKQTSQGSKPAIRPKSTQLIRADGTESSIHWVRRDSLVRRLRRHLAKKNHRLLISAECSPARDELGEYAVIGADGHPLQVRADLDKLARFLGVLADDELVEPPAGKGWVYHAAREHVEIIDGKRVRLRDRLTKDYRTERAARKAVSGIDHQAGLVIVGMDADDALAMRFEEEQQAKQAAALAEIHVAIEGNPTLRYLRSEAGSQADWDCAVEIDLELQQDTAWAKRPVAERFDEVVNRLADLGLVAGESEVHAHG